MKNAVTEAEVVAEGKRQYVNRSYPHVKGFISHSEYGQKVEISNRREARQLVGFLNFDLTDNATHFQSVMDIVLAAYRAGHSDGYVSGIDIASTREERLAALLIKARADEASASSVPAPISYSFGGSNYGSLSQMLRAAVLCWLGPNAEDLLAAETSDVAIANDILEAWGGWRLKESQELYSWAATDLVASVTAYRAEVEERLAATFRFGRSRYDSLTEMLRAAAEFWVGGRAEEFFAEHPSDTTLAGELAEAWDGEGLKESQELHGWTRADLEAAFAAYRAEVTGKVAA